jgi:hypothetical protein
VVEWAIATSFIALFLTLAPLVIGPSGVHPPIWATVLFPALVIGVVMIVRFLAGRD